MGKEIKFEVGNKTYERMEELVEIQNFLNKKLPSKKKKEWSVEDFVKGCIVSYLESFSNTENMMKLAGLNDPENHPRYHNRFKEIAADQNVSQRDVVRMTGINQSSVSQIFNNRNESNPRLDTFFKIWVVLKCPPINQCLYRVDD